MLSDHQWIIGINPCIHGMNYHDPSAVLIKDGEVICAIEEERFNGIKGAPGTFPIQSVYFCLEKAGILIEDLTAIAVGYSPKAWDNRLSIEAVKILYNSQLMEISNDLNDGMHSSPKKVRKAVAKAISSYSNLLSNSSFFKNSQNPSLSILNYIGKTKTTIEFHEHHLCHAASAYFPSNMQNATAIVMDGVGEAATSSIWKISNGLFDKVMETTMPNSLGYFYAVATAFLGFTPWQDEGKLMALAPYGKHNDSINFSLEKIINLSNPTYDVSSFVIKCLDDGLSLDINKAVYHFSLALNIPPRQKDEPINEIYKDIAFAVQNFLEKAVLKFVKFAIEKTGISNICAAGGIFLNCKLNMVLRESSFIDRLFIQPVANDAGLSLGAAMLTAKKYTGGMEHLKLGVSYTDRHIELLLGQYNLKSKTSTNLDAMVASYIAEGKVVFYFKGSMEFGKRALGARSILADPRDPMMSDMINHNIKHREVWRPFACSVLEEYAHIVFENYEEGNRSPYMIEAYKVKDEWKTKVPAIIHKVDFTTRPQTVSKEHDPAFHALLDEFRKLTGIPLLLNTSLNDKGQPLIMLPMDAIKFFNASNADCLVLNNRIITK